VRHHARVQTLSQALVGMIQATRRAEQEVIGSLPAEVVTAPMPGGEWSPKDVQAHISGWKARQARRFAVAREGGEVEQLTDAEVEALNAELRAARRDWGWTELDAEADQVTDDLLRQVLGMDPEQLAGAPALVAGVYGNGTFHPMIHLAEVGRACDRTEPVARYLAELVAVVGRGGVSDAYQGTLAYNVACIHALDGRLDDARAVLPAVFRLNPPLREFAPQDPDLAAIRDEIVSGAFDAG
jgi:hypothetical protein